MVTCILSGSALFVNVKISSDKNTPRYSMYNGLSQAIVSNQKEEFSSIRKVKDKPSVICKYPDISLEALTFCRPRHTFQTLTLSIH